MEIEIGLTDVERSGDGSGRGGVWGVDKYLIALSF